MIVDASNRDNFAKLKSSLLIFLFISLKYAQHSSPHTVNGFEITASQGSIVHQSITSSEGVFSFDHIVTDSVSPSSLKNLEICVSQKLSNLTSTSLDIVIPPIFDQSLDLGCFIMELQVTQVPTLLSQSPSSQICETLASGMVIAFAADTKTWKVALDNYGPGATGYFHVSNVVLKSGILRRSTDPKPVAGGRQRGKHPLGEERTAAVDED